MSTVIVTMAGSSRRFREAGVEVPKWAIHVAGASILKRAVTSIGPLLDDGWKLIFVALSSHLNSDAWKNSIAGLRWDYETVALESTPPGQALSANAVGQRVAPDEPIAIWNVDTMILPGDEPLAEPGGNWLTLTEAEGDHWSFAELDETRRVRRTAEKVRISPFASIGLYGFSSMETFGAAAAASQLAAKDTAEELYVAPLYNYVILGGQPVRGTLIASNRLVPLGTPTEVLASCRRLGWPIPEELRHL